MEMQQVFIKIALQNWQSGVKRATALILGLPDEALLKEEASGKNRGIYIVGHLVAIDDALNTFLELGERTYPALDDIFVNQPDKAIAILPGVESVKQLVALSDADWFSRHAWYQRKILKKSLQEIR